MKKLTSLLLALIMLFTALTLSGCVPAPTCKYILTQRYREFGVADKIDIIATSNTNTFQMDDVSFDLSYATHLLSSNGYTVENNGEYAYGVYLYSYEERGEVLETKDLSLVKEYYVIDTILPEEAMTDKYLAVCPNFFIGYGTGDEFNYTKTITIPEKYVKEEKGYFYIELIMFYFDEEEQLYYNNLSEYIEFEYKKTDQNTIEIEFDEWKGWKIP
ncbi:MAG: hypothetical protein IJ360_02340 [Clostridia bacterium]|nr:hypothetical protein [Clostridia bacterium]